MVVMARDIIGVSAGRGATLRGLALLGALLALMATGMGPFNFFAHDLFTGHMVRHLVMMNVTAVLLAMAWPARHRHPVALSLVTAVQMAALWLWHMPAILLTAHHSLFLQGLMQVSLLAVALLFWRGILANAYPVWHRIFALLITAKLFCLLGAALVFSRRTLYPAFGNPEAWGMTALEDQHLAGLLMVSSCALIYVAAAIALFARWLFTVGPDAAFAPK